MEITVKTRSAGPEELRIYINVHDGGKHPVERPSVKGVKINKKYWNRNATADKMNWVNTKHSQYPKLNKLIYKKLTEVEAKYKGQDITKVIEDRERAITGGRKLFLRYAEQFISERRNATTKANDQYGIKKLKAYLEEQDNVGMQFKEITKQLVREYYAWLLQKVSKGSANQYMNTFRTIFNAAQEDERVQIKVNLNPFEKLKKEKPQRKNKSLTQLDLEKFKSVRVPAQKPKWLEAKHMFLFQFSGAYRVKDIMYLQWQDIRETDNGIIWDNYTSKTQNKFTRTLPLEVQLLLLPALRRYFPDMEEVVNPLRQEIENLKSQIQDDSPKEMSATEMLSLIKSGYSLQELEEQMLKKLSSQENVRKQFKQKYKKLEHFVSSKIIDVSFDRPTEFVWSYGNRKRFTLDNTCDDERNRVLQSVSSYDRFLDVLRRQAKIRTHISSHVSRHTATVQLYQSGANPEEVSKLLTHKSLSTTEAYRDALGLNDSSLTTTLGGLL
ncbi:tyrosine-type recombinase/integrase [Salinimicrobium sediminilitoris]|uniref:tyrosine-type recombinase/integrase n=1 Tax=Salinimicrobium sediminilitoris TaxID=2876715 RepID=UPI001E4084F2|nr:site-specific integrase [Salinimicrobium sediminilitoris]MCC8360281.1 site-specific integrase [Salinimicrobium sediminilitoris]